jgi:hypothetical protein
VSVKSTLVVNAFTDAGYDVVTFLFLPDL